MTAVTARIRQSGLTAAYMAAAVRMGTVQFAMPIILATGSLVVSGYIKACDFGIIDRHICGYLCCSQRIGMCQN